MHFEIMRGGRGCGGCGGVLSRERGVFGSAANLRGTVERTPGRQPRGVGGGGAAQAAPVPVPSSPHHLAGGCGAAKAPLGASVSPAFSVAEGNTRVPQPLLRPWACGVETHAQAHARR